MRKRTNLLYTAYLLTALACLTLAGMIASVRGQGVICCNIPVDIKGDWIGSSRYCKERLEKAPPEIRTKACETIQKAGRCPEVEAICGGCDPDPYPDYLRKRQISLELFKHASDLRLTASKLVAERWGAESDSLRIEAEKEVAGDLAWEQYGPQVTKRLGQSRGALSETWVARQAVANAPFAVKAWNAIGWIDIAVQTMARGWMTAGDWSDYQKEAQKATKEAEEMWSKALADLEASLKQAPACLEASRKAAEDEKNLDRAKAAIEKWDNNQNLYWDPIKNEAVTYDAALKRADHLP